MVSFNHNNKKNFLPVACENFARGFTKNHSPLPATHSSFVTALTSLVAPQTQPSHFRRLYEFRFNLFFELKKLSWQILGEQVCLWKDFSRQLTFFPQFSCCLRFYFVFSFSSCHESTAFYPINVINSGNFHSHEYPLLFLYFLLFPVAC